VLGATANRRAAPGSLSGTLKSPRLFAVGAGAAVPVLLPNLWGVLLGVLVTAAADMALRRIEPAAVRDERLRAIEQLPVAADLLASTLRAGLPVDAAVISVSEVLGGPLGKRLGWVGRALRLGASTSEAWRHLADLPPARRLISAAERSTASGTALAGALLRCADDLRSDAAVAQQAGTQRAAVLIVLPLGLCFLPAFVLAGLTPVILAVLGEVL
jgi:pilus assembly protein TadC